MQRLLPAVELFNTTKVANANARLNAQTHTNMKFHAGIPMMTLIRGGPHSMLLYLSSNLSPSFVSHRIAGCSGDVHTSTAVDSRFLRTPKSRCCQKPVTAC